METNVMGLSIVIAGKDGPPLSISLPSDAKVQHLNDAIFDNAAARLSRRLHRLRFIAAGKNIGPFNSTLHTVGLTNGAFVHCVVSDVLPCSDERRPVASESDSLLRQCAEEEEEEGNDGLSHDLVTIDLGGDMDELEREQQHANGSGIDMAGEIIDEGSVNDWMWGFVLGVLLGLIMMILAMDRSIALSVKWKRGIGYGTVLNMIFGVFLLATGKLD